MLPNGIWVNSTFLMPALAASARTRSTSKPIFSPLASVNSKGGNVASVPTRRATFPDCRSASFADVVAGAAGGVVAAVAAWAAAPVMPRTKAATMAQKR